MSTEQLRELGPIDYIVLEWAGDQPVTGEVMPLLLDLVDRGVIRILDLAFLVKAEDGSVAAIDLAEVAAHDTGLAEFEGASSGLLGQDDLEDPVTAPEPSTVAGSARGRTAPPRPSPSRFAAPVVSSSRADASPFRRSSPRWRCPRNDRPIRKNTLTMRPRSWVDLAGVPHSVPPGVGGREVEVGVELLCEKGLAVRREEDRSGVFVVSSLPTAQPRRGNGVRPAPADLTEERPDGLREFPRMVVVCRGRAPDGGDIHAQPLAQPFADRGEEGQAVFAPSRRTGAASAASACWQGRYSSYVPSSTSNSVQAGRAGAHQAPAIAGSSRRRRPRSTRSAPRQRAAHRPPSPRPTARNGARTASKSSTRAYSPLVQNRPRTDPGARTIRHSAKTSPLLVPNTAAGPVPSASNRPAASSAAPPARSSPSRTESDCARCRAGHS